MLDQWGQAFQYFGWHTRHSAGETGRIQAVFGRSRPGTAALKQAESKGLLGYGPFPLPDGDPDRICTAGHELSRHSRSQRPEDHPWQEMSDRMARGNRSRLQAVQNAPRRRSHMNRAKCPLVMWNLRADCRLDRE